MIEDYDPAAERTNDYEQWARRRKAIDQRTSEPILKARVTPGMKAAFDRYASGCDKSVPAALAELVQHVIRSVGIAEADMTPPEAPPLRSERPGQVYAHMTYITRNGKIDAENERGEKVAGLAELKEAFQEWGFDASGASTRKRALTVNVVLSMPEGTDTHSQNLRAKSGRSCEYLTGGSAQQTDRKALYRLGRQLERG